LKFQKFLKELLQDPRYKAQGTGRYKVQGTGHKEGTRRQGDKEKVKRCRCQNFV